MTARLNGVPPSADAAAAKAQRKADEASAWQEYLDERGALARRSAELKALRLAAAATPKRQAKPAKRRVKANLDAGSAR